MFDILFDRYFGKHFERVIERNIRRGGKFGDLLIRAKEAERKRVVASRDEYWKGEIEKQREEFIFELQEKDAEIAQRDRTIIEMKKHADEVNAVYFRTIKRSKINVRIIAELQHQMERVRDSAAQSFSMIADLGLTATENLEEIEDNQKTDKKMLGRS